MGGRGERREGKKDSEQLNPSPRLRQVIGLYCHYVFRFVQPGSLARHPRTGRLPSTTPRVTIQQGWDAVASMPPTSVVPVTVALQTLIDIFEGRSSFLIALRTQQARKRGGAALSSRRRRRRNVRRNDKQSDGEPRRKRNSNTDTTPQRENNDGKIITMASLCWFWLDPPTRRSKRTIQRQSWNSKRCLP